MLFSKSQRNISSGSAGKVDYSGLAIFLQQRPFLIPDQPEIYYSKVLQPCHAACEI